VGAIQIANSGIPMILGPDGPTIGGYPKAAVVVSADLDRVGQMRPGDKVSFRLVTEDQAEALRLSGRAEFESRIAALKIQAGSWDSARDN
jgi:allophanate hydrolase subunit 2